MSHPSLDRIIGSSPISHRTFDIHYASGAFAFPSYSLLSIINPHLHQRLDITISQHFREISALSFSPDENQIAIGESGANAFLYLLTFNNSFTKIISKKIIPTKENGFSCLAFNSKMNRLISIGADEQPFLILWDLSCDHPIKLGYYRLTSRPNEVIFNTNCSLAVVAGKALLKLVQTNFPKESSPIQLKATNINFKAYKNSSFVDLTFSQSSVPNLYALTYEGTLCLYPKISDPFAKSFPQATSFILTPIKLDRGKLTALAEDHNIIFFGGEKGIIWALRYNENGKFSVAGKIAAVQKRLVTFRLSQDYLVAVYEDGHTLLWKKSDLPMYSPNAQSKLVRPEMNIFYHCGPICKIISKESSGEIVTCGSDSTIRIWDISPTNDLVSACSQEMVFYYQFDQIDPDFLMNYTGVRAATYVNDVLIAGLNDGTLHLLEDDREIDCITSSNSITALASHESYFASGDNEGTIRLYQLDDDTTQQIKAISHRSVFSIPITSLLFTQSSLVASSQLGIKFISFPDLSEITFYETASPILSCSFINKANLIAAACCDRSLQLLDAKTGKLFMRFILSNNYYPVSLDSHPSGLAIAAAMSDETVLVIDTITGDTIYTIHPSIGLITSVAFHENGLIISSFTGCLSRWNFPEAFQNRVNRAVETVTPSPIGIPPISSPAANLKDHVSDYSDEDEFNITISRLPSKDEKEKHTISESPFKDNDDEGQKNMFNGPIHSLDHFEEESSNEDDKDSSNPHQIDDPEAPRPQPTPLDNQLIRSSIWLKKPVNNDDSLEIINIPNSKPSKKPITLDFNENKESNQNESIIPLHPDEDDITKPFELVSSSDDNDEQPKEEVIDPHEKLATAIRSTAQKLKEQIEQAKAFLMESFTDEADIQAHMHLRNLIDSFNLEKQKNEEKKAKMIQFSQKMLEMASSAEKLSKENLDVAFSFSPQ